MTVGEVGAMQAIRDRLSLITPDAAPAILPGVPVALTEAGGPKPWFVAESPPGQYPLAWAILSSEGSPVPIAFDADPFQADAYAYTDVSGARHYLCLTGGTFTHELFFHSDPSAWRAKFRASGTNQAFTLTITNADNQKVRTGTPTPKGWAWLSTTDIAPATSFSTDYFGIDRKLLLEVLRRQWATVNTIYVGTGDAHYGPVPRSLATSMWQTAQLSQSSYVHEVFDCEDFAYSYKGTVCRQQLADHQRTGIKFAYAVGCVQGRKSDPAAAGHAVNLFIDETFTTMVLEPQNGSILPAGTWEYKPDVIFF
jgi:hypothetical protein